METQAFVYKWTHIPTLKWYIGSRSAKGCHINDGYITSSKIVKPMIQSNPSEWHREILAIGSPHEMRELEIKILDCLDAKNDHRSFNQSNGDKALFNLTLKGKSSGRKIQTPIGIFERIGLVAEHYNTTSKTIHNWIKFSKKDEFFYITDFKKVEKQLKKEKIKKRKELRKFRVENPEFYKQEKSQWMKLKWNDLEWKNKQLEKRKLSKFSP